MNKMTKAMLILVLLICSSGSVLGQQGKLADEDNSGVLDFQAMTYPPIARAARVQGAVVVRVEITAKGKVTAAEALSGPGLLIAGALANVKTWTFRPNATNSAIVVYNFTMLPGVCSENASMFVLQNNNVATVLTCPLLP